MLIVRAIEALITAYDKTSRTSQGTAWDDPALADALRAPDQDRLRRGLALLAESRTNPELRALRVRKISRSVMDRLDELTVAADDENPDVLLLLGTTRIQYAWEIRGGAYARYVGEERFRRFWAELRQAEAPLRRAAELLPDDPVPWDELQWFGIGMQVGRRELDRIWNELLSRWPSLYAGHFSRVQAISDKWYGSDEEAAEFAEALVAQAKPGDPVVANAAAAHFEIAVRKMDKANIPEAALRNHFVQQPVYALLAQAADLWLQDPIPHPMTLDAHHLFGAAFYIAGDLDRARRHLGHLDRRMPDRLPWGAVSLTPGRYYSRARKALRL
ncbi:hypothetical protein [Thermomonospora amylolytica]|uniref:hypothetical protein n=1 Tax=Thermomonospora amylolytica TaxID=1411117 RepID=UPI000E6C0926|nr:hypothetical protein [Thermomonospora amylolytica]